MIKQWWTAKELAGLSLPEVPSSERRILEKAKKEDWQSQPRAKGKGNEYHISNLPQSARIALIEKLAHSPKLNGIIINEEVDYISQTELRRDSRLLILSFLDNFRQQMGCNKAEASEGFAIIYNERAVDGLPEWVCKSIASVSSRSLRRWMKDRKDANFAKLGQGQNNRKGTGILDLANDGKIAEYIGALIIKNPHLTSRHIETFCRVEFGEFVMHRDEPHPLPNTRSFIRFIAKWKEENKVLLCRETSPDEHKNKHVPYMGNASEHVVRLNQLWEVDASPADALCEDGRYQLYAIEDIYSRRVIMHVSKTANSEAVLHLLRKALIEWGVPENIKTDNGTDFVSQRTVIALSSIGISQPRCEAYQGQQKGHVERIFRTFQHDMTPLLEGFIGHNVGERKKIEARKSFAARMGKEKIDGRLTPERLQEVADKWCKDMYQHRVHSSLGESPFSKAAKWTQPIRKIENIRALDLLLAPLAGHRTVTKGGVRVKNGHYWSKGFVSYMNKTVMVRFDPDDMGVVYCFDPDTGEFICEAIDYNREGVNRAEMTRDAQAAEKAYHKEQMKGYNREKRKFTAEKFTDDYMSHESKTADKLSSIPQQSIIHNSEQLMEAARAMTRTKIKSDMSPDAEKHLEQIKKDMVVSKSEPVYGSDEDRWYAKWKGMDLKLNNGMDLIEKDQKWYEYAQTQSWWKSRSDMEQFKREHEGVSQK